ncbi:MAG: alpha/beta fold hydrolase [Bacteroidia bacterium]
MRNVSFLLLILTLISCQSQEKDVRTQNFPRLELTPAHLPAKENTWVFILAGQSNMAGRGLVEPADTIPSERILTINKQGEIIIAKEPLHFYEPAMTGLDCGLSFGKTLLKHVPDSIMILLIPTAVGGSSVSQWLGDSTHRGVPLLSNFREKTALAKNYGDIKGILWHQGESDANEKSLPVYPEKIHTLFTTFREIVGNDRLPILMGELGSYSKNNKNWQKVNEQMHIYSQIDSNVIVVSTADFVHKGDSVHFNSEGQRMLGQRFAEAYWVSGRENVKGGSNVITVDGSKLEYVVEGEGIPCLVIGSSVYYPKTFSMEVRKHLKMYFVDMKWFARDYQPENLDSVNIESIVDDVEEIRGKLGLEKPLILGHSIHGTIATEYVKKFGNKTSGLIVIASPCEWGNPTFTQKAEKLWETASAERKKLQEENWGKVKELDRLTGQAQASREYNTMSPQYWYNPRYDARWLWDGMTVHEAVTQHLFTKVFQAYNMFDRPVNINVPVFVGIGKYDYVIPHTLWKTSYPGIPDFTLVLFDKSGHTPQLEEYGKFDEELMRWVAQKGLE